MRVLPADRISRVAEYYFSTKLKQIKEMESSGIDVINLGIGNPDMPASSMVTRRAKQVIDSPGSHRYQPYKGIDELRFAFSEWYMKKYDVSLSPDDEILPLMGSKEGIMHISMAFLNRGDGVLIPDPGYPAYEATARLCSARCLIYDLKEENRWMPDLDLLERSDLDGIKLMWVNYPNMPTGQQASKEELSGLVEFGLKNRILIVNDNPYSLVLNDNPVSLLSVDGAMDTALELNSLSKSHNMAGWRIGMVGGAPDYIGYILRVKSSMDSGMFLPLQYAAIEALGLDGEWYSQLNKEYAARRDLVYSILDRLECTYKSGQSGLFVWAKIPSKWKNSEELSDFLLEHHALFVTPGSVFGSNGYKFIRISLCIEKERLSESMDRIIENITY
ncbi:MAG TPA: aminotransferase class I/II-fold pyridoxal phosphate-dependent enzyme [Bacteroidales bacterium]|nr:aminotransferase class I/II-fold pyridoxal phosphate-dependent enzyme [Bacteroidales bacterium]